MKTILLLACLSVFFAAAHAAAINWGSIDCANKTYAGVSFATAKLPVPDAVNNAFNGDTITLNIDGLPRNNSYLSGTIKDGFLIGISCTNSNESDLEIQTSTYIIDRLAASASPIKDFKEFKAANQIQLYPRGGLMFVKIFFFGIALAFMG
jgi:hypothetical protein